MHRRTRHIFFVIILIFYVTVKGTEFIGRTPDLHAEQVAALYHNVGYCFDGDYRDYFSIQYIRAPEIVYYEFEGCP